eukprot:393178-Rhodomonas_salina.1
MEFPPQKKKTAHDPGICRRIRLVFDAFQGTGTRYRYPGSSIIALQMCRTRRVKTCLFCDNAFLAMQILLPGACPSTEHSPYFASNSCLVVAVKRYYYYY